jgi:hypothetical protein
LFLVFHIQSLLAVVVLAQRPELALRVRHQPSTQHLVREVVEEEDLVQLILGHLADQVVVLDHLLALVEAEQLDKEILEAIMP